MSETVSKPTYDYAEILSRLSQFFPADQVKSLPLTTTKSAPWKGKPGFYIDARAVQQRLDDTCIWQILFREDPRSTNAIQAGISILVRTPQVDSDGETKYEYEWLTRWDGADDTDFEATKGGLSSAMRRAAVQWGVGRYLYEVDVPWKEMKAPRGGKKPKYFVKTPRVPAEFLPGKAQRARATNTDTGPKTKAKASPGKKEEPAKVKLTTKQTAELQKQTEGRSRTEVGKIYNRIVAGEISFEDGLAEVKQLDKE